MFNFNTIAQLVSEIGGVTKFRGGDPCPLDTQSPWEKILYMQTDRVLVHSTPTTVFNFNVVGQLVSEIGVPKFGVLKLPLGAIGRSKNGFLENPMYNFLFSGQ